MPCSPTCACRPTARSRWPSNRVPHPNPLVLRPRTAAGAAVPDHMQGGSEMFTHRDVLQALAAELCCSHPGTTEAVYRRAVVDSRQVQPGDLFIGLRGERHDGNDFA
ncbi:MAG: hypothetical protein C4290_05575, partial [Chloroflexota bacterium]